MSARELGLILATADDGDVEAALGLAHAARARGLAVTVFAMHDGVRALAAPTRIAAVAAALDHGCELQICATSARAQQVDLAVLLGLGVREGSQDDHAALAHRAHRLVAFA